MATRYRPKRNRVREEYTEFTTGGVLIGVITDPKNPAAWIESTLTVPLEP